MRSFSHIQNDTLRAVLEGGIAPMTNTIGSCVDITFEALSEDARNQLISPTVVDARHDAADEAVAAYNDGDIEQCLNALRRYWSI